SDHVHRRGLLPRASPDAVDGSIHASRVSCVCPVDAVTRHRTDQTDPVRLGAGVACADFFAKLDGHRCPRQHSRTPAPDPLMTKSMDKPIIQINSVNFWYGQKQALFDVTAPIAAHCSTAFIGPSGCGKSTLLRCLNRMNELIDHTRVEGTITMDGQDIYASGADVIELSKRGGMVYQKSNPFPKSISDNVAYGLRIQGNNDKSALAGRVESSLQKAALWDEVKDRLTESALQLSGGQQQRLCIARAIA